MKRLGILTATILAGAVVVAATAMASGAPPSQPRRLEGVPRFGHVFLIIGENTSRSKLTHASAPFLTTRVRPHAAWLTNYYAVADGSLADYVAMTSGQFTTCDVNDNMPPACHQRIDNLFHQLDVNHVGWREWNESMPNPCAFFDSGTAWWRDIYTTHHNPAVYYDNIEGGVWDEGIRPSRECVQRVVPAGTTAPNDMTAFNRATATGDVPRFNLVIPNDCEQGHDPCAVHGPLTHSNPVRQFDQFLAREIPIIQHSPAYQHDGVIIVTYDEGSDPPTPNRFNVLLAILSPLIQPGTYTQHATHYSLLRTLEDGFGITHHLQHAATATPIATPWRNLH